MKKIRKAATGGLTVLVATVVLAACGGGGDDGAVEAAEGGASGGAGGSGGSSSNRQVKVGFIALTDASSVIMAYENGDYADRDRYVTARWTGSPS